MDRPIWQDHREHLHLIAREALEAVDPFPSVIRHLSLKGDLLKVGSQEYELGDDSKVFVVGAGKAGVAMARGVESVIGQKISAGIISVPALPEQNLEKIDFICGGHPLPTEGSVEAGEALRDLLMETGPADVVLVLISGGGSALLELPLDELQLEDLVKTNDLLLKSGAPIHEFNAVRKELSLIKGGGLAQMAAPARTAALILSDVVGDHLDVIASGPTVPSTSNAMDALEVLKRYELSSKVPRRVLDVVNSRIAVLESSVSEEIKTVEVNNILIGSNSIAASAAETKARVLGYHPKLLTTALQGEASVVGRMIAKTLKGSDIRRTAQEVPICLIMGGETTVSLKGDGIGGRNQELALSAAIELDGEEGVAIMTFATDGIDGPTPAAGAIVTGQTLTKARSIGLDAMDSLMRNDSYSFFKVIGDAVITGPSGTNVNDLVFCVVYATEESTVLGI